VDPLSNAITTMMNNEDRNKRSCVIAPASKLIGHVLRILQQNGYIGAFEFINDGRSGKFIVQLLGRINRISSVKPRYPVQVDNLEIWERKYLPARDLGFLILTTSQGVLTNKDAKTQHIGGSLLAYVY
jgi:small subunit ribosomal protein S8